MFFISYAKNFFIAPSDFGIGAPIPIRSFPDALDASAGGRNTVVFVDHGHKEGAIRTVVDNLVHTVREAGKEPRVISDPDQVLEICPSSLRGVTTCFAAAQFLSSPDEGPGGLWNYTLRADAVFGTEVFVDTTDNDAEIYVLPLQRAIDAEIAQLDGTPLPETTDEYIYTSETNDERAALIRSLFMESVIDILGDAFFLAVIGVLYHLVGFMATERETGLSQLIEAMTPNKKQWHTQAARLLALHISFCILYAPAWILMSLPQYWLVYPSSPLGITLGMNLLAGLSLTSFAIFGGAFFRKAQLSGISITILGVVLAIIAQVTGPSDSAGIGKLSSIPHNFCICCIY
jgi:ATP-binding cassette, subfamily A (ABC1), member 3